LLQVQIVQRAPRVVYQDAHEGERGDAVSRVAGEGGGNYLDRGLGVGRGSGGRDLHSIHEEAGAQPEHALVVAAVSLLAVDGPEGNLPGALSWRQPIVDGEALGITLELLAELPDGLGVDLADPEVDGGAAGRGGWVSGGGGSRLGCLAAAGREVPEVLDLNLQAGAVREVHEVGELCLESGDEEGDMGLASNTALGLRGGHRVDLMFNQDHIVRDALLNPVLALEDERSQEL
jgi:hypothetical protein